MRQWTARQTLLLLALCLSIHWPAHSEPAFRFVKSVSGPSGKVIDNRFQFDEKRNRFVYPQDRFLTVYFEWQASPGDHILTAYWKDPKGAVVSISPDVKIATRTPDLHAYWIFELAPHYASGIWTVEIRIDGEPAGSHSFELVIPEVQAPPTAPAAPAVKFPTLDELYVTVGASLVWVHKLDSAGHHTDTTLGFVQGPEHVVTAFQAIDAAERFEVVFADGRKVFSGQVWSYNRLQDWAVLKVDTGNTPPLHRAANPVPSIGERDIVFNVENETARVIGGVDITGRRSVPEFGDRIQLSPSPSREAIGGPLLNSMGEVMGIIGGSLTPGSRFSQHFMSVSPSLWSRLNTDVAATPISLVPQSSPGPPETLSDLLAHGILTPPLQPTPSIEYGGTSRSVPANPNDLTTSDTSEFTRSDRLVYVYTLWLRKDQTDKGVTYAKIYDVRNHLLVNVAPRKIALTSGPPLRISFNVQVDLFPAGVYRVDVFWNDQPAWRTFFRISE